MCSSTSLSSLIGSPCFRRFRRFRSVFGRFHRFCPHFRRCRSFCRFVFVVFVDFLSSFCQFFRRLRQHLKVARKNVWHVQENSGSTRGIAIWLSCSSAAAVSLVTLKTPSQLPRFQSWPSPSPETLPSPLLTTTPCPRACRLPLLFTCRALLFSSFLPLSLSALCLLMSPPPPPPPFLPCVSISSPPSPPHRFYLAWPTILSTLQLASSSTSPRALPVSMRHDLLARLARYPPSPALIRNFKSIFHASLNVSYI